MLYDDLQDEVYALRNKVRTLEKEIETLHQNQQKLDEQLKSQQQIMMIAAFFIAILLILVLFIYPLQVILGG